MSELLIGAAGAMAIGGMKGMADALAGGGQSVLIGTFLTLLSIPIRTAISRPAKTWVGGTGVKRIKNIIHT